MQVVKLSGNKTVDLVISMGSINEVKSRLQVFLLAVGEGGCIEKLMDDQSLLVDVLYVLCRKSCEDKKISDIDFGYGMEGDNLRKATEQFLVELKDFLPLSQKMLLESSLKLISEIQATVVTASIKRMESMKEQVGAMIISEMDKKLTLESLENSILDQQQR